MAQCPVCQAEIPEDFGLLECESCGAQLIVHVDGRVEHSGAESGEGDDDRGVPPGHTVGLNTVLAEPDPSDKLFELDENSVGSQSFMLSGEESADGAVQNEAGHDDELVSEAEPESEFDPAPDSLFAAHPQPPFAGPPPLPRDSAATSSAEASTPEEALLSDEFAAETAPEPEPEVYRPQVQVDSPDLSDIAHFGNSDTTSSREGHLRYTLHISGIDTSDVREAFREAITDRKFMWDTDQILRSIRNGEVRITNVAASKAYILVSRLRTMPVHVTWEQYAIHQT